MGQIKTKADTCCYVKSTTFNRQTKEHVVNQTIRPESNTPLHLKKHSLLQIPLKSCFVEEVSMAELAAAAVNTADITVVGN